MRWISLFIVVGGVVGLSATIRWTAAEEQSPENAEVVQHEGAPAVPETGVGRDMLGRELPLDELEWLTATGGGPIEIKGHVTLVRWWTDTCPYCRTSLPAIGGLREKFRATDFQTVAVYHPKPPRDVPRDEIVRVAHSWGYDGAMAVDQDWDVLIENYLSKRNRPATSVSFLLDRRGKIRFVHPGPEFHPSDDPREAEVNADYEEIVEAIDALLMEGNPGAAGESR